MVIDDRDVIGAAFVPAETDAPLVVDPDTVFPRSAAPEFLDAIAWRRSEVVQPLRGIDEDELPEHDAPQVGRKPTHWLAAEEPFGLAIGEAVDHSG